MATPPDDVKYYLDSGGGIVCAVASTEPRDDWAEISHAEALRLWAEHAAKNAEHETTALLDDVRHVAADPDMIAVIDRIVARLLALEQSQAVMRADIARHGIVTAAVESVARGAAP